MVVSWIYGAKKKNLETSRVVQWLRFCTPNAGGLGFSLWSEN